MPAAFSRRAVLAGALGAAATAACTSPASTPQPTPTPPTPEQLTRKAAVEREQELGRLATVALDAYPGMAGAKSTLTFSTQHVHALSETLVPSPSATGSQSTSDSVSRSTSGGTSAGSRAATARSLATALLDAAAAHRSASTSAPSDLARLLVSVAASDSALAALLLQQRAA